MAAKLLLSLMINLSSMQLLELISSISPKRMRYDNLENILVQGDKCVPIVRKWGHPWLLLNQPEQTLAWNHLTESELRQLHRRFGHPSIQRLYNILSKSGHEVEFGMIEHLTK